MTDQINQSDSGVVPVAYPAIDKATREKGFTMPSDILTDTLLKIMAASKPAGKFLELGTGTGLSTSWILDGMDDDSSLISLDNDKTFMEVAEEFLGQDGRLELIYADGADWIAGNQGKKFDYIFADTWPGKYLLLEEVLEMVEKGGFYIVDDMMPQPNWPDGHGKKVMDFVTYMESRSDFDLAKQDLVPGVIVAIKK